MLFSDAKDEALQIHEKALNKYNVTVAAVQEKGEALYLLRQQSIRKIEDIEALINCISKTPREMNKSLAHVKTKRQKFLKTEEYAIKAYEATIKAGVGAAVGVAGGVAAAGVTPAAAMWVATTFGKASTGKAISELSGVARKNAAHAFLGRGVLAAGGKGVKGGEELLKKAAPIGLGIAALALLGSGVVIGGKNKIVANKAIKEAEKILTTEAKLSEAGQIIVHIQNETDLLLERIDKQFADAELLKGKKYSKMTSYEQLLLGTLVNNTQALAELLNKTVE